MFTIIKRTDLEALRSKARQHDTLKIYTDDKIRELEQRNQKLQEENTRYRDAVRQMLSAYNYEKQKQHYNSLENFIKKMNTKIKELKEQFRLD